MKSLIMMLMITFALTAAQGQGSAQALEQLVFQFNEGGVQNDIERLQPILHDNFRIVFNNTAENKVQIIDRANYLDLIEKKVFGGEARDVKIETMQIDEGLMASVKTQQQGSKNTIFALKQFVYQEGRWLMTEEIVYMK